MQKGFTNIANCIDVNTKGKWVEFYTNGQEVLNHHCTLDKPCQKCERLNVSSISCNAHIPLKENQHGITHIYTQCKAVEGLGII